MRIPLFARRFLAASITAACCISLLPDSGAAEHPVPREHPRLLGPASRLKQLARERPEAYTRVKEVARKTGRVDDHSKLISLALVYVIDGDRELGRQAVDKVLEEYINRDIRSGHVTFGHDLARTAIVYDFCHPLWTGQERKAYHDYMNRTIEANVGSEPHVFHNGWYGYKHWGYGLSAYATYYENPRAPEVIEKLDHDIRTLANPALVLSGRGGGFAEGYYIHYWLYEWLFFLEAARYCQGVDYYSLAPEFFKERAIADMFEMYPGIGEQGSRRPIHMGDGGGRRFGGDRDKSLSARRILVSRFRDDPANRTVHAFNEHTPRSAVSNYAYKDLLWHDTSVPEGDLENFELSHISTGPGFVYARSSWEEDATHFFFKCGDRFTAHQHLDNGHFMIYKYEELASDGGQYYYFGNAHDANYHLRTIAHSTMLVYQPHESWPAIRAWKGEVANDGGQHHKWPHHNGAVGDAQQWQRDRELYDIADILAYEDHGDYMYVAGDCSRAYSRDKLDYFTRQIVYLRPGTFVIFDRVKSTFAGFEKTWLLQAMKKPEQRADGTLVVTNGRGRLFVRTLLPENAEVNLAAGEDMFCYRGNCFPPEETRGPAPECRIEVSPSRAAETDYFLHVLTATGSDVEQVDAASFVQDDRTVTVNLGDSRRVVFLKQSVGGRMENGRAVVTFARAVFE